MQLRLCIAVTIIAVIIRHQLSDALHHCQPLPLGALHCLHSMHFIAAASRRHSTHSIAVASLRCHSTHSIQRTALPLPAIATWRTPFPSLNALHRRCQPSPLDALHCRCHSTFPFDALHSTHCIAVASHCHLAHSISVTQRTSSPLPAVAT